MGSPRGQFEDQMNSFGQQQKHQNLRRINVNYDIYNNNNQTSLF